MENNVAGASSWSKVASNPPYLCVVQEPQTDTLQVELLEDSASLAFQDSICLDYDGFVCHLPEDSIPAVVKEFVPSLFEGHLLHPKNDHSYLDKVVSGGSFGFFVLLFCAAVFVYIQRSSEGFFGSVFKASFDANQANQDARVENSQRSTNLFLTQIIALVSISLFTSEVIIQFGFTTFPMATIFFPVLGGLIAAIVLKRAILWILAQLFSLNGELRHHKFNLNLFLSSTGLSLLPLSLLLFYSPQIPYSIIIYTGLAISIVFYLKGLHRGVSLAITSSSIVTLHLFYYFCALEILPVFVLIRCVKGL
ncbi:MAG: DUF4271 domain-containing protein [Flavobacteriales bacterium]|nr:DUF4271 domain-containing protein [Flavobacteriales bacterium]